MNAFRNMKDNVIRVFCESVLHTHPPFRQLRLLVQAFGVSLMLLMSSCHGNKFSEPVAEGHPVVLDERLTLSLFAEDPDIVTPIGIAVDSMGRVYVLESHTHSPPKGYAGPEGDRIKVFTDDDGDGEPEKISVFAEGFREGVNIAFSPDGNLYVVTSRAVYVLYDADGDGISEERKAVAELTEPEKVYAHAALLGITFSPDNWMYISRGNTGSASWKLTGSDKSSVSGYGDGGNIIRARPDGSAVHEIATGFWNPADIKFDAFGRLLAADNDPDSRGPNRLVHVVEGGDYGYRSLYGGSGIHPYSAWNGELPGTLPYAVALGEAPSGLLDASLASLPEEYVNEMLASIWEESRIVRVSLAPEGVSVSGKTKVIVEGGETFRPVAFAAAPGGDIYFTDWVLRSYPNHGRGRIWKLSTRAGIKTTSPRKASGMPWRHDPPGRNVSREDREKEITIDALRSDDPFARHAAVMNFAARKDLGALEAALSHDDPVVRTSAMVAMQRGGYESPEKYLRRLLRDPDAGVRTQALIWIGTEGLNELQSDLDACLLAGAVPPSLFETYLETVRHLDASFIHAYRNRSEAYAKSLRRSLPDGFLENFIHDNSRAPALRALAIPHLDNLSRHVELLTALTKYGEHPLLRFEAIQALARVTHPDIAGHLADIAKNVANPVALRAEAILSLMWQRENLTPRVSVLLKDAAPDIRIEAARYIRTKLSPPEAVQVFRAEGLMPTDRHEDPFKEQISITLLKHGGAGAGERPASLVEWQRTLAEGGDVKRGRRVFYSPNAQCSSCHAVDGKGGDLGPDLSKVASSKTRDQLIAAVLNPSAEITPEYQGWYVKLSDGSVYSGRQIDIGENAIELYTHSHGFQNFPKTNVSDYGMISASLMPENLQADLTPSDLRDLMAFLEAEAAQTQ